MLLRAETCAVAVERFAPSPTGRLHLGHAYSALLASESARAGRGRLLLRIEDIDPTRCRPEYEKGILEDLRWLGVSWHGEVLRQSSRMDRYARTLGSLEDRGLLYACSCTRGEIESALAAPQEAPGGEAPENPYPGTCRPERGGARHPERPSCRRLHLARALEALGGDGAVAQLDYAELGAGGAPRRVALDPGELRRRHGDAVLARKDVPASYHLAVVVDDAAQGVTRVTRGEDLSPMTPLHRLLQALLGLPTPAYRHHPLMRDGSGRRLAKRDRSLTLEALRRAGVTPRQVADALRRPDRAVESLAKRAAESGPGAPSRFAGRRNPS